MVQNSFLSYQFVYYGYLMRAHVDRYLIIRQYQNCVLVLVLSLPSDRENHGANINLHFPRGEN